MPESTSGQNVSSTWVDHIPVIWIEPPVSRPERRLVIFLTHLGGTKEEMIPFLHDIGAAGSLAVSFDLWEHGERGSEKPEELFARAFKNFRRCVWPIDGQTALDTLRVVDWSIERFKVGPFVSMGGISTGGDIAIDAAGIDHRIDRVAAVIATPDWLRPGMCDPSKPEVVLPQGQADSYAQFFYDIMNPMTHLQFFEHGLAMRFFCGEKDTHVPADGAFRFKEALEKVSATAAARVGITMIPGVGHMDADPKLWWRDCLEFLTGS